MAKILIIDDDKIMCDLLSEMAHEMGHRTQDSQSSKGWTENGCF